MESAARRACLAVCTEIASMYSRNSADDPFLAPPASTAASCTRTGTSGVPDVLHLNSWAPVNQTGCVSD